MPAGKGYKNGKNKTDRLKSMRGGVLGRTISRRMPRMEEILRDGPTRDDLRNPDGSRRR